MIIQVANSCLNKYKVHIKKTLFSSKIIKTCLFSNNENNYDNLTENEFNIAEDQLESKTISNLLKKIDEINLDINNTKNEIKIYEEEYNKLNDEYGSEITRVKKEFSRMKERSIEESVEIISKAKVDALKDVLPINDNYFRAKSIYQNIENENEKNINDVYEEVFNSFSKVIQDFGVKRVESLGKPFDFNFMEAIMTAPSTEYQKDLVSVEYQAGYKMGDKCVRPAMVVVSLGPGPA